MIDACADLAKRLIQGDTSAAGSSASNSKSVNGWLVKTEDPVKEENDSFTSPREVNEPTVFNIEPHQMNLVEDLKQELDIPKGYSKQDQIMVAVG